MMATETSEQYLFVIIIILCLQFATFVFIFLILPPIGLIKKYKRKNEERNSFSEVQDTKSEKIVKSENVNKSTVYSQKNDIDAIMSGKIVDPFD